MRRLSQHEWEQLRTAYASGIPLRELARKMGVPAGTVVARAKRQSWTREIQDAKAIVETDPQSDAISAADAAALSLRDRGQRTRTALAEAALRASEHAAGLEPATALDNARQIGETARTANLLHGWERESVTRVSVNLAMVAREAGLRGVPLIDIDGQFIDDPCLQDH